MLRNWPLLESFWDVENGCFRLGGLAFPVPGRFLPGFLSDGCARILD